MKASQINSRIHNSKDSFIIGAMLPCYSMESVFLILAISRLVVPRFECIIRFPLCRQTRCTPRCPLGRHGDHLEKTAA